jgi:signal transduction histidine kinase
MKRLWHWITARLWRRLMFGHLIVIVLTMLILQVIVVTLFGVMGTNTTPVEEEAGWWADSLAYTMAQLIEKEQDRDHDMQHVLEDAMEHVIVVVEMQPEPADNGDPITGPEEGWQNETILVTSKKIQPERLLAVTILNPSGVEIATYGLGRAQQEYPNAWNDLVERALRNDAVPSDLCRLLTMQESGLLLGTAPIVLSDGQVVGVVAIEMYPSIQLDTLPRPIALFLGFVIMMTITSVLGIPILILATFTAIFSSIIVSRSLGKRLRRLENSAQEIADGNLARRITDTSSDEIGQLGHTFNRMAERLSQTLQALEAEKEQVEALMQARRDLVANVSHDLRTPIASLSAHLETLSERPERLNEYMPILNDETARVAALIDDLFELSRMDTREMSLDLRPVALESVIGKVVANYKSLAWEQRRIVLAFEESDELPAVMADVQRVEQILINLIANGLRYTPEGGIVTIEADALQDAVEVRVSDTGVGVPPEDLPHIFERFYRGDRSRGRPDPDDGLSSGSGLGLAIVKGLVEAMGGSTGATSTPGEGTCISFRLPRK